MICANCRREITSNSNFCYYCGARQYPSPGVAPASHRLMRSSTDCKIAGVCGGFAEHFGWDPTLVRIIWLLLTVFPIPVTGLVAYVVCWVVMPVAPPPLPSAAPAPQAAAPSTPGA